MTEQSLSSLFVEHFKQPLEISVHAPGRVNLIGEHTDYNQGFVFPAAINFGTDIVACRRDDDTVEVLALDYGNEVDRFLLNDINKGDQHGWANYVRGVVLVLKAAFPQIQGASLAVTGNVPQGAGLSSSASFEIALLKTFAALYELPLDGIQAALLGQKAENEFVGCACGIMDQLISALGEKDCAMLLDCRDLTYKHTNLPTGYTIMIINSNVKRGLVDSEYNVRRQQCEEAASALGLASLRDATMPVLLDNQDKMSNAAFKRAHHVISENDRTLTLFDALNKNDIAVVSAAMRASHISMRDDFEITVPAIDALVEIIHTILSDKGGVRMTGGGFGGCVVALVPDNQVKSVSQAIEAEYESKSGYRADIYICSAEKGAFA